MPEVSFIIPTHNRAALLAETVDSAQRAGRDVEVIIVDDGSTDNTAEVCAKLPGIRYLRFDRNRGQAAARNAGILESSAEFIAFLDDDDLRLPGTIDLQVQVLKAAPEAALVYGRVLGGDSRRRLPTGQILPAHCPQGDVFWELLAANFILINSVVARRRNLVESGLFRSDLNGAEDWELWLRLSARAPFNAVEEVVALYRFGNPSSGQVTSDRVDSFRAALRTQEVALQSDRARAASAGRRRKIRRRFCDLTYDVLVYEAAGALAEGDKRRARAHLRFALSLYPFRAPAFWWMLRCLFVRPDGGVPKAATH
ncbi:MAG TPA: glycosyltransferase family 2 protein [Pyrinomonadaceae bacterium]|nr:glycosyltransferase family 2 protein [Pyrinomonadaceae bacterium]